MSDTRQTRFRVRRSSSDPPLAPGATYFQWDVTNDRERVERRVREEHVQAPDGRTGHSVEWEETIHYQRKPVVPRVGRRASGWEDTRSALRAALIVVGLFVAIAVAWDSMGGPLWLWLGAWLGLSTWLA
jgi:hypothetical protein